MRHIKVRRRFRLILVTLFVVCLMLFFESRIEAFAPQVRNFAALKIEETFSGRINMSIGTLAGGIVHPFVLNDIKVKDKKGSSLFSSLDINSIQTNYRIWDVLLKRSGNPMLSQFIKRNSRVYINFVAKDNKISGFVRLDGDLENSHLIGYVNLADKSRIDFSGEVKGDRFNIEIKPAKGTLRAEGVISDTGDLEVNFKANHLELFGFDIVGDAALHAKAAGAQLGYAEGELEAKNLVVNYNPFLDLKASYRMKGGVFEISDFNFGDSFKGRGNISLKKPFNTDLVMMVNNVSLSWLLSRLSAKDTSAVLSGTLNAKFELKGPVSNLKSNSHLEIRKGTIAKLEFDYLSATLKGDGPIIRIEDSRITRESGYFTLGGEMDLRKIGKNALFSNIKITSDDRAITWDGWNEKKVNDVQEYSMKKKINDDINLNFKTFVTEEKVDASVRDTDKVQVEYKLHSNDSLRMTLSQDSDFFGFEHKDKF